MASSSTDSDHQRPGDVAAVAVALSASMPSNSSAQKVPVDFSPAEISIAAQFQLRDWDGRPTGVLIPVSELIFHEKHLRAFQEESVHVDIARKVISEITKRFPATIDFINTKCEIDRVRFNLVFEDSDEFNARCVALRPTGSEFIDYGVFIGLDSIRFLINASNKARATAFPGRDIDAFVGRELIDDEITLTQRVYDDLVGMIPLDIRATDPYQKLVEVITDAMTLMLLHEISHGLRGHNYALLKFEKSSQAEFRRAMEADADWGAGYLFMSILLHGYPSIRAPIGALERFIRADRCNYLAFQLSLFAESSKLYHRPPARSQAATDGACQVWYNAGGKDVIYEVSFGQLLQQMSENEIEFANAYPKFREIADERSQFDIAEYNHKTQQNLSQVHAISREAAPLKGVRNEVVGNRGPGPGRLFEPYDGPRRKPCFEALSVRFRLRPA